MAAIRGSGNKRTELRAIETFRRNHIAGWRRNWPIYGKPDFVFPRERVAVFIDGCFWHCCPKHFTKPSNNAEFWERKIAANQARDRLVTRTLKAAGWTVVRIWEHSLATEERRVVGRLRKALSHPG